MNQLCFTIRFSSPLEPTLGIEISRQELGLKDLDQARLSVSSSLQMSDLGKYSVGKSEDPQFPLSEEEARKCGLFETQNSFEVKVDGGQLNVFCDKKFTEGRNDGLRTWQWVLNQEALWAAWEDAGFPKNWRKPESGLEITEEGKEEEEE